MENTGRTKESVLSGLNESYCVLLPKNSSTVFLFWKFSEFKADLFSKGELREKILIKIKDASGQGIMEICAGWEEGKIYITLPKDDFECFALIYSQKSDGQLEEIAKSDFVTVPRDRSYSSVYSYEFMGRRP